KAEKEQPERKLGIVKQSNYAMVIESTSEQGQERPKEKCCQTMRIEETQKAKPNQTPMKQSEEKNQYKVKTQEVNKES
ncbi:1294_t:CDS:1, partial [Cetraspora pellucida]